MHETASLLQTFETAEAAAARIVQVDLGDEARPLVAARAADLAGAARALADAGLTGDAVSVLAQALQKRAAVWWACVAARESPGPAPSPAAGDVPPPPQPAALSAAESAALLAAEAWVREPDTVRAHAAFAAANAAELASPAACAALAAFFAADNIAPPGSKEEHRVPPPDHVAGLISAGAVQLAAVRHRPDIATETLAAFIDRGFAIAAGRHSWN